MKAGKSSTQINIPITITQLRMMHDATKFLLRQGSLPQQRRETLKTLVIFLHGKLADLDYTEKTAT